MLSFLSLLGAELFSSASRTARSSSNDMFTLLSSSSLGCVLVCVLRSRSFLACVLRSTSFFESVMRSRSILESVLRSSSFVGPVLLSRSFLRSGLRSRSILVSVLCSPVLLPAISSPNLINFLGGKSQGDTLLERLVDCSKIGDAVVDTSTGRFMPVHNKALGGKLSANTWPYRGRVTFAIDDGYGRTSEQSVSLSAMPHMHTLTLTYIAINPTCLGILDQLQPTFVA